MKSDVTIIGGGPAGSTAGILLARAGWDVTIIEQSRFPRDKVCGECISALGFDVLTRLGLDHRVPAVGAVRLDRAAIYARQGRSLVVALPKPMWGLSRHAFDGLLLDAARAAGVFVREPVRCEALDRTAANRPELRLRNLLTNLVETVAPSNVIVADGKASFATKPPTATNDFGIKAHFTNVDGPRDAIELFSVEGSYGGLAAIEDGRWNAAFSVPAVRLRACRGNLDKLMAQMVTENHALAERIAHGTRIGPWLASPLPRFAVRTKWPANVVPVGNAAAALEPIGGEGMGLALRSAEMAAEAMMSGSCESLPIQYARLWRIRRLGCRTAAIALSQKFFGGALIRRGLPTPAIHAALRLMGKC